MSDVVVSVVESATNVVVSEQDVAVAITETNVEVSSATAGIQGASYAPGDPIFVTVRNSTGATLPKGTIVYTSGANGNHVQVSPALATSDATSARVLGWLSASLANNADGFCQVEGYLEGLDTQGFTAGQQLYLSGTVAGGFTATKPQAPIHLVYVGVVTKVSAGDGHVYIKTQNGYELDEIHDVQITSVADGDVLEYDSATSLWKNRTLTNAGIARLAGGNTFTGNQTFSNDITHNAFYQNFNNMLTSGRMTIGLSSLSSGVQLGIYSASATNVGSIIRGASGQSANLQSWQLSDSTEVTRIRNGGQFGIGSLITGTTLAVNTDIVGGAGTIGAIIRGASGQTADLQQWQNSASSVLVGITPAGNLNVTQQVRVGGTSSLGQLSVTSLSAGNIGAVIRGAASQTANLQEWQNSAGTIQASIDANGMANLLRGNFRGAVYGTGTYFGAVNVLQESGGHGVVIQGRDSQTTDILRIRMGATPGAANDALMIQNSAGSTIARIDNGGNLKASNVATLNTLAQLAQANSGGVMIMGRATAQFSSPGANSAALYFRDGTNAGTLKLVVRAGATGAETTILDNIPQ